MAKKEQSKKKKPKEQEVSVSELDKKLAVLPYTSTDYEKVLGKIQKKEKGIYGDQHILCVKANALMKEGVITNHLNGDRYQALCNDLKLGNFSEFNMISGFEPRYMVEHDYRYKQVLTFGYITDRNRSKFIVLRKKESNRMGMIGGHTDFSLSAYGTKPEDFLIKNLYKELFEEVKITTKNGTVIDTVSALNAEVTAKWVVNENDDPYRLRNLGIIYEVRLNRVVDLEEDFIFDTNEPNVHTVECVSLKDISDSKRYHSMLKYIPDIIEFNRFANK